MDFKSIIDVLHKDDKTGEHSDTTLRAWIGFLVVAILGLIIFIMIWNGKTISEQMIELYKWIAGILGGGSIFNYALKRTSENLGELKPIKKEENTNQEENIDENQENSNIENLIETNKPIEKPKSLALKDKLKQFAKNTYGIDCNKNEWVMFGIRGGTIKNNKLIQNDNKIDYYNDSVIIIKNQDMKCYEATVDPGKYWIENPMEKGGAARLEKGVYKYKPGTHRGKKAFNQSSKVKVMRDVNQDGIFSHEPINSGYFGINIHWTYNLEKVGKNSAGCIVIKSLVDGKPWKDFYSTMCKMKEFYVIILESKDLDLV